MGPTPLMRPQRDASEPEAPAKRPRVSVAAWVTSSTQSADARELPAPTTCSEAYIRDRDSVFIGYVYPLVTASPTYRSALLEHLSDVVHPDIPNELFPPQFQDIVPGKRKSTHNMYAFRVMQLKPGRNGLGGPSDFGTAEGHDDDGETWGSEKIMRVIREMGASDVLVIVSRWYGGQMLGPVRFQHITNVARAALQKHFDLEALQECRKQLQNMDAKIQALRHAPVQSHAYEGLTMDRAKRLLLARKKTLDALQRPKS